MTSSRPSQSHVSTSTSTSTVEQPRPGPDPRLLALAGAAFISTSAMFIKLSGTSAATASFFRCGLALPVLLPLAIREWRCLGPRPRHRQLQDLAAGLCLGVDYVLWGVCIVELGAGVATVIVNVQVVIGPVLAWLFLGERMSARFALTIPVMLTGVALAGNVLATSDSGGSPTRGVLAGLGAGMAYAGYLLLLRGVGAGARGPHAPTHRAVPVLLATAAATALSGIVGLFRQDLHVAVGWPAIGWLVALALSGQVCGWLLIGAALPRLPTRVGSAILLVQPVIAVLLGLVFLREALTVWQFAGCLVVLLSVWNAVRVNTR